MKVIALTKRWSHHTASGGYDRLAAEMEAIPVTRPKRTWSLRARSWTWWKLQPPQPEVMKYLLDYTYADRVAERRTLVEAHLRRADLVHVLYGDEQLDLLLKWRKMLPCPLVATFHLPTERAEERFEKYHKRYLGGLDAAVAVARRQVPALQGWFGEERVAFIPHGIDVERFQPAAERPESERLRVMMVGGHMRDWDLARKVIEGCAAGKLKIAFTVITQPYWWPRLAGCEGVERMSEISEEELIRQYQKADVLFNPVESATACNAVLESLACGTPVLTTRTGGMEDYVNARSGWFVEPGDWEGAVELLEAMSRERNMAEGRRAGARAEALEFSWKKTGREMKALYRRVTEKRPAGAPCKEEPAPAGKFSEG